MKRDPIFTIGGIFTGLLATLPFLSLGIACVDIYEKKRLLLPFLFGAILTFTAVQLISNRRKHHSLKNYYLMSAVVSIGIVIAIVNIILRFCQSFLERSSKFFQSKEGGIIGMILIYAAVTGCVGLFIGIFSGLTKHKSEYIGDISKAVSKIAKGDEEIKIAVRGNDELAVLSESINRMRADLKESERKRQLTEQQKNELISNVSHDLRSPLTSIIGYVQLLKEYENKNDERYSEYIEVIDRRLSGLEKLINELFELTKMESPSFNLQLEKGDITAFIKQFGYEMKTVLRQNGFALSSNIDNSEFVMQVDFERLARVMENLFSNVIKYAVPDTEVILETSVDTKKITIILTNHIRSDAQIDTENMFERFYKEDSARTDSGSAGLGLAIAKRIVDLHGGHISAITADDMLMIEMVFNRNDIPQEHE